MAFASIVHNISLRDFSHAYAVFVFGGESPWGANSACENAADTAFVPFVFTNGIL